MASFDDITNPFTGGLSHIITYVSGVVNDFQNGDTTFRGRKDGLIYAYEVGFQGLGASMFSSAVENNIQISSRLQQKLGEFVMATDHTNKQIQSANQQYDGQINYNPVLTDDVGLRYYGYSGSEILNEFRDGALGYIDFDVLLIEGSSLLTGNLDSTKSYYWYYIQQKYNQNMDHYEQTYNEMKNRRPELAYMYKEEYDSQVSYENGQLTMAKDEMGWIYDNIHSAITGWFGIVSGQIGDYNNDIAWAAATGEVTVGEILQDLVNAPNGSPVVIYQTANGGLVVGVNTFNDGLTSQQNAALVEQAIENYDQAHGLKNPQVTVLGYQGGNDIVQFLAKEGNTPYHIENVVLVGAKIDQVPATGTNYIDFVAPGDTKAGYSNTFIPQNTSEWVSTGINGGEIALGFAGGVGPGLVATGEAITSEVAPSFFGGDTNVQFADPNGDFNITPRYNPNQTPGTHTITSVPDEPGESSNGFGWYPQTSPYIYGKTINYTQSTYLNSTGLPDPNQTGGQAIKGFEPISLPTYYNFQ